MRFLNTSRYADDESRALIEEALGDLDVPGLAVRLKNSSRPYRGRAYEGVPELSPLHADPAVRWLVTIGLGGPEHFPCSNAVTSTRWLRLPATVDPASLPPGEVRRSRLRGARGRTERRVVRTHGYGGVRSPIIEFADWREALVAVAAHEGRHVWQYRTGARRSEVDAELHAAAALERYRAG